MSNLLQLLLDQPSDLLDQLYKNRSDLKPIHLAVAAEQKMRDVCLYLKGFGFVSCAACSDGAKEYLSTLDGYSLAIDHYGKRWLLNGRSHREDGPAVEYGSGSKLWWVKGKRHREDGPAIEQADGTKEWYLNGQRHREDGPAYEGGVSGTKAWWINGQRHRNDGPAIEQADGTKEWWLNGKKVTQQDVMPQHTSLSKSLQSLISKHGKEEVYIALSKI